MDFNDGRKEQGASTLTMQLARGLWLDPEKSWNRKAQEVLITLHLEHSSANSRSSRTTPTRSTWAAGYFQHRRLRRGGARLLRERSPQITVRKRRCWPEWCSAPATTIPTVTPTARATAGTWCCPDARNGYLTPAHTERPSRSPEGCRGSAEGASTPVFRRPADDELQTTSATRRSRPATSTRRSIPICRKPRKEAVRLRDGEVDRKWPAIRPARPRPRRKWR